MQRSADRRSTSPRARRPPRSASWPTAMDPLAGSPTMAAGRAASTPDPREVEWSRRRPSVQTRDSPSWSEEMPPQATPKSPVVEPLQLRSATASGPRRRSRCHPVGEGLPQLVGVRRVPDRWAALELGLALGDVLSGQGEVVRAGLDREAYAGSAGGGRIAGSASARRGARCGCGSRSPVAAAITVLDRDGLRGPAGGRPGSPGSGRLCQRSLCLDHRRVLGVHDQQPVEGGDLGHGLPQLVGRRGRELRRRRSRAGST